MAEEPVWGQWAWENRDKISHGVTALWRWLWPKLENVPEPGSADEKPGVLVLGPGGVGKSTLGKVLSGKFDPFFDLPETYDESLDVESYELGDLPGMEILVPPGQPHRREATWHSQLEKLATGKFGCNQPSGRNLGEPGQIAREKICRFSCKTPQNVHALNLQSTNKPRI